VNVKGPNNNNAIAKKPLQKKTTRKVLYIVYTKNKKIESAA